MRPRRKAALSSVREPFGIRQDQLPSMVPGRFMRAFPPSSSTSCIGTMTVSAFDAYANRMASRASEVSEPTARMSALRTASRSRGARSSVSQPTVVLLSCVPV